MAELNVGDKVRVKERPDWPSPPGYKLANAEAVVTKIWEQDGPPGSEIFQQYIEVKILKPQSSVDCSYPYNLRREALEKI